MKKLLLIISIISSIGTCSALLAMEEGAVPGEIVAAADQQVCTVCMEPKSLASFYRLRCGHDSCCRACLINIINDRIARRELAVIPCPEQPCEMKFNAADMRGITGSDEAHKALEAIKDEIIGAAVTMPLSNDPWSAEIKPCPCCGIIIEKDAGCVEMTCNRCSYQFCWDCMRPFWETGGHAAPPVGHSYGAGFHIPGSVACGKQPLAPNGGELSLDHKLLESSQYNNPHLARLLLRAGASIAAQDKAGRTSLMIASFAGKVPNIRVFLAQGAVVDQMVPDRQDTALMAAAFAGHRDAVRLLLAAHADVNIQKYDGVTALMHASCHGHSEVVRELLAAHADVNKQTDPKKWTALLYAVSNGYREIVNSLIAAGAEVNHEDSAQKTALKIALDKHNLEMVKILVAAGADTRPHLCQAVEKGRLDEVKMLISMGADVNALYRNWSPLALASLGGHEDIIQELLGAQANVNIIGQGGRTPLMEAVRYCNAAVVRLLLAHGADTSIKDKDGATVMDYFPGEDIKQLLLEHMQASVACAAAPLDGGAAASTGKIELNSEDLRKELAHASKIGDIAKMQSCLDRHAEVNACDDITGWTALMHASYHGQLKAVNFLIEHGADLNARGACSLTSLMLAAAEGYLETVKTLVEHGADVTLRDRDGKSALLCARWRLDILNYNERQHPRLNEIYAPRREDYEGIIEYLSLRY